MGILDHRRTWQFTVSATPDQCLKGFSQAMSNRAGLAKARWTISPRGGSAIATYQGLSGAMGVLRGISKTSAAEADGARGSEVTFETEATADGRTVCSMWLSSSSTRMGFTNDARFIRPYMAAVEKQLRSIDAGMMVAKG